MRLPFAAAALLGGICHWNNIRTAIAVCASAEGITLHNMTFQLDWKFNAQFAGIFMADHTGGLSDAGVHLEVRPWGDGINAIAEVAEGRADFGCAEQNLVIAAQAEGLPVKAVATMFQFSPYGLMALPTTALDSLADLESTDVGVHVDGLKVMALVMDITGLTNINVTEIPYADKWARVASGELAAVQCYTIDEPIGVASTYNVTPNVLKLSDYGFISTAQTIVVSEETLAMHGDHVTKVLGAIFQGWTDVLKDKPAAAAIVVDNYVEEGSVYKDVAYQTQTLELLEPYVLVEGRSMGVIDPDVWKEAANLMVKYGIVETLPESLDDTLALEFYTGPIVFEKCDAVVASSAPQFQQFTAAIVMTLIAGVALLK